MEDKSCPQLRKLGKWNNWGGGDYNYKRGVDLEGIVDGTS